MTNGTIQTLHNCVLCPTVFQEIQKSSEQQIQLQVIESAAASSTWSSQLRLLTDICHLLIIELGR